MSTDADPDEIATDGERRPAAGLRLAQQQLHAVASLGEAEAVILASAHSSHVYRTGLNLYFTFAAHKRQNSRREALYDRIWSAALTAVHDVGVELNPLLVAGQVHGGIAQALGQALMEDIVYEPGSGQLLSGSFMDYSMPRASDMPDNLGLVFLEIPCPSNILGVKGGSETGTIGPPAAIGNAVVDALWHLGVRHVELPITSQNIWRALKHAGAA